jgi:hypothetical protein
MAETSRHIPGGSGGGELMAVGCGLFKNGYGMPWFQTPKLLFLMVLFEDSETNVKCCIKKGWGH